ncbi:MAG TPA: hypothetical protein VNJ11_11135 [Bryobacteraceae bacterium]|nr:hypothetical protein [Bryobacteraceae bacterium]
MRRRIRRSGMLCAAFLVALWRAPLEAGAPKEVTARWEELAPLVEKREIETVLANGVHIRGRAEQVLPEALVVEIKRTSDPNLVPKGRTRVARESVSVLTVRWKRPLARILLPAALFFLGQAAWSGVSAAAGREPGEAEAYVATLLWTIAGYGIGDVVDRRRLTIRIVASLASPGLYSVIRSEGKDNE